jgi:putative transposase
MHRLMRFWRVQFRALGAPVASALRRGQGLAPFPARSDRMARLFLEVLFGYRSQEKYLLHEFVLMPDYFYLLITPLLTLERALQLIKWGFSFRAKKELGFHGEIWEKSFYDRRVRDWVEYSAFRQYIHLNPVKRGLALAPQEYPYSSARTGLALDAVPQRLKPSELSA